MERREKGKAKEAEKRRKRGRGGRVMGETEERQRGWPALCLTMGTLCSWEGAGMCGWGGLELHGASLGNEAS